MSEIEITDEIVRKGQAAANDAAFREEEYCSATMMHAALSAVIPGLIAAAEDREREAIAAMFEEEVETYHEGMSAIDVRLSYTRGLKWPQGRKIAAAIRARKG